MNDDAENLFEVGDDGHTSDSDDDSLDVPPPLRERLCLSNENLRSSSGRLWSTNAPSAAGRRSASNICREGLFSIKADARLDSEREILRLFIGDMLNEAVHYTNVYGKRSVRQWNSVNREKRIWRTVDLAEMEAFIGLHILAGAFKSQYRSTEELWSKKDGQPVFRATMSRERFCALKSALRFDDPVRRNSDDPLAPIRYVFEVFVSKLRRFVVAGPYLTVDEQLVEFHGRVRFKQYIGSKPGKFGIKIFWVCDAASGYCLNGLVYIGKNAVSEIVAANSNSVPESVVIQLCQPFLGKGQNITADNWFTSFSLIQRLREQSTTFSGSFCFYY